MKRIARILCLVISLSICACLIAGCGDKKGSSSDKDGEDNTPEVVYELFDAGGESNCVIVRPEKMSDDEKAAVDTVFSALKEKCGQSIKKYSEIADHNPELIEIVIGNTAKEETKAAIEKLRKKGGKKSKDNIICFVNGKIVIAALSDTAIENAAERFVSTVVAAGKVSSKLCDVYLDETEYQPFSINGNTNIFEYSIVRSHYETSYITQLELEKLQKAFCEKCGYFLPIVEDAYTEPGEYEIVIGGCNREEAKMLDGKDEYRVRTDKTKIYLEGGSDRAIAMAVTELANEIGKGKGIDLKDGVLLSGDYNTTISTYDTKTYLKHVWGDDFDGNEIDKSKWHVCTGSEMNSTGVNGKTVRRSTPETTFVAGGCLYQCAAEDDQYYYGGFLRTTDIMHFKYGYIEIKEIIPDGPGFWTALWLNASDYNKSGKIGEGFLFPEIDVTESFGNATNYTATLHRWPTAEGRKTGIEEFSVHTTCAEGDGTRKRQCLDGKTFNEDFHTMGCYWNSKLIRMTCDGLPFYEYDISEDPLDIEAFNHFVYINLSLATYFKNCPLTPNATEEEWQNSNKFIVDYVHLYQTDDCELKFF